MQAAREGRPSSSAQPGGRIPDASHQPGRALVGRRVLITRDMELIAELISELLAEHAPRFSVPDPARVQGTVRSAAAGGLAASLIRYGGFTYSARVEPVKTPLAVVCTGNSGIVTTPREDLSLGPGDAFMPSAELRSATTVSEGDYAALQVPWEAVTSLAETAYGVPAAKLRFQAMAPVTAARGHLLAATARFVTDELVVSKVTEIDALIAAELARVVAAVFLETFPNTAMTAPYLPNPGWTGSVSVRRAAEFIDAHADQPVTLDGIAAAAGTTARALQYAFRRHSGTTPMGYLRWVRMGRAHLELSDAEPGSGITVAAVARRWGWPSQARFAATYERRYGQPPSRTLRAGPASPLKA